jgi:molybdenum cofactor biosynthesis protein B
MEEHRKTSPLKVKVGIITLSDTKYQDFLDSKDTDISGNLLKDDIGEIHDIASYHIIPDEKESLLRIIDEMMDNNVEVIITTGGTGIGKRDITIETIKPLFEKELNGFGEIFRYQSYLELGSGAILSRATAGVYKGMIIISMPGSPNAVKTGLKIVKGELGHLVRHLKE